MATQLPTRNEIIRRRLEDRFRESDQRYAWLPVAGVTIIAMTVLLTALFLAAPRSDGSGITSSLNLNSMVGGFVGVAGEFAGGDSFQGAAPVDAEDTTTATPRPTAEPTPSPVPTIDVSAATGSPYSASALIDTFSAAGLTVSQQPVEHAGFDALTGKAVRLKFGDSDPTIVVAVVYETSSDVGGDWQTQSGQAPRIKSGHALPDAESIWWNRNVVLIVLDRGASSSAAFDAFFRLR